MHNLVAHEFVPNPQNKEYVYNANSDNANCRADNLFLTYGQEINNLFFTADGKKGNVARVKRLSSVGCCKQQLIFVIVRSSPFEKL